VFMASEKKISVHGLMAVIIYHLLLFIVLFFYGLKFITPPPPEMGIAVNLGMDDAGAGLVEPMSAEETAAANTPSEVAPAEENTLTQDVEETPVVAEKKTIKPKETVKPKDQKKEEKNPVEEKKTEPKKVVNKKAMFGPNTGNESTSQGITEGTGNQGKPDGNPNSNNYSNVSGTFGDRVSEYEKPDNPTNFDGRVVIFVVLDQKGNVIDARQQADLKNNMKSTTFEPILVQKAIDAAKKSTFKSGRLENGYIYYNYKKN